MDLVSPHLGDYSTVLMTSCPHFMSFAIGVFLSLGFSTYLGHQEIWRLCSNDVLFSLCGNCKLKDLITE